MAVSIKVQNRTLDDLKKTTVELFKDPEKIIEEITVGIDSETSMPRKHAAVGYLRGCRSYYLLLGNSEQTNFLTKMIKRIKGA